MLLSLAVENSTREEEGELQELYQEVENRIEGVVTDRSSPQTLTIKARVLGDSGFFIGDEAWLGPLFVLLLLERSF